MVICTTWTSTDSLIRHEISSKQIALASKTITYIPFDWETSWQNNMAETSQDAGAVEDAELRRRLPQQPAVPQQAHSVDAARQAVVDLNNAEEHAEKDEKEKRTYGRTPNGTGMPHPDLPHPSPRRVSHSRMHDRGITPSVCRMP